MKLSKAVSNGKRADVLLPEPALVRSVPFPSRNADALANVLEMEKEACEIDSEIGPLPTLPFRCHPRSSASHRSVFTRVIQSLFHACFDLRADENSGRQGLEKFRVFFADK